MDKDEVCWDVEEALMNAWPSPREILCRGWLFRIAGGRTRRTNSVNPLRSSNHDPGLVLDDAARLYARNGQPLIFRVPTIAAGMDAPLAALGFSQEEETCTLLSRLGDGDPHMDASIEIASHPRPEWLALRHKAEGNAAVGDYEATLRCVLLPKAFVALRGDSGIVSTAFGAIDRGYLLVESVATIPEARNRGFARRAVSALMNWGRRAGAKAACLQVVVENAPARALYERLGFNTDLYRYHYRRAHHRSLA